MRKNFSLPLYNPSNDEIKPSLDVLFLFSLSITLPTLSHAAWFSMILSSRLQWSFTQWHLEIGFTVNTDEQFEFQKPGFGNLACQVTANSEADRVADNDTRDNWAGPVLRAAARADLAFLLETESLDQKVSCSHANCNSPASELAEAIYCLWCALKKKFFLTASMDSGFPRDSNGGSY